MDNFWVIPIVALIAGCIIGVGAIEYKVNTVWPNAIIELDEIQDMSCDEIIEKNTIGRYWTLANGKFTRESLDVCKEFIGEERRMIVELTCKDAAELYLHDHNFVSESNRIITLEILNVCTEHCFAEKTDCYLPLMPPIEQQKLVEFWAKDNPIGFTEWTGTVEGMEREIVTGNGTWTIYPIYD